MFDPNADAERLIRCFDPDASLVEGRSEHLVISPRWGRLLRKHPLLAASPEARGKGAAWQSARHNLLGCRDRSVQLALATYQHPVRITIRVSLDVLQDPQFDLHQHCHAMLDRHGEGKGGVILRREALWIRTLLPDADGLTRFEFSNTFLLPITPPALIAEARAMW
jgi:hypothetical protein